VSGTLPTTEGGASSELALGRFLFLRFGGLSIVTKQVHRESRRLCFNPEVHIERVRRLTMMVRFESRTGKAETDLAVDFIDRN